MSRVDAYPMTHVRQMINPQDVYIKLMELVIKLAENGLIHGDFNEFNLMIDDEEKVTLIDFPQMISIDHPDAKFFFDRDVQCIQTYFFKKYEMEFEGKPTLADNIERTAELDKEIKQSVFMKLAIGDGKIEDLDMVEAKKEEEDQGEGEDAEGEEGEADDEEIKSEIKEAETQDNTTLENQTDESQTTTKKKTIKKTINVEYVKEKVKKEKEYLREKAKYRHNTNKGKNNLLIYLR